MLKWVIAGLITTSLLGCHAFDSPDGTFRNRTQDYLAATTIPPMKIPAGVNTVGISSHYVVTNPPAAGSLKEPVNLLPPDLAN